jgi:hypothetical protein
MERALALDEAGYRDYLRDRFAPCFGPDDSALRWSVERLVSAFCTLKLYGRPDLVVVERVSSALKFRLTLQAGSAQSVAECEKACTKQNLSLPQIQLLATGVSFKKLSRSLEVIESYRPGLGKRLTLVVKELLREPLERNHKPPSSGSIETASVPPAGT